jgi:hypothetical protein
MKLSLTFCVRIWEYLESARLRNSEAKRYEGEIMSIMLTWYTYRSRFDSSENRC